MCWWVMGKTKACSREALRSKKGGNGQVDVYMRVFDGARRAFSPPKKKKKKKKAGPSERVEEQSPPFPSSRGAAAGLAHQKAGTPLKLELTSSVSHSEDEL